MEIKIIIIINETLKGIQPPAGTFAYRVQIQFPNKLQFLQADLLMTIWPGEVHVQHIIFAGSRALLNRGQM